MKPLVLAPLDARWIPILEAAAECTLTDRRLAALVERLSRKYLGEQQTIAAQDELAARVLFFFARDLHKVVAPVAELVRAGGIRNQPLKLLDIGAGVGASTIGVILALQALKGDDTLTGTAGKPIERQLAQIAWVDTDTRALQRGLAMFRSAKALGLIPAETPEPELHVAKPGRWAEGFARTEGGWDLIVASNVLTEVLRAEESINAPSARPPRATSTESTAASDPAAPMIALSDPQLVRAQRTTELIGQLLARAALATHGSLLVIEPAMQRDSRVLQHTRGLVSSVGLSVFAPCVHSKSCPLLVRERDWCHDDLELDLPEWLVAVAQGAGLRYQGLTYAYLTLRKDSLNVRSMFESTAALIPARWVSHPRVSKGKVEIFVCAGPTLQRAQQLDRVVKARTTDHGSDAVLADSTRGQLVQLRAQDWTEQSPTLKLDLENWRA
jgi:hypothetical protein